MLCDEQPNEALIHFRNAVDLEKQNPYYISFVGVSLARAERRWTPALKLCRGSPVVARRVRIGVAIDPKATGAVFAIKQTAAARNGENPRPVSIVAATATGVPNPAHPSINAPKANATSIICRRPSSVK